MTDRCGIVHALRKHIVQRRRMRHPLARRFVAGIRGVDIARWREARDGWLLPMVQLALETAMRQGELRRLRWQHIDLNRRTAHLPDTKNGEARTVPLSTTAARERAEHDGGRQHHRTQGPTHAAQVYASEGGGSGAEAGVNRVSIHRQRLGILTAVAIHFVCEMLTSILRIQTKVRRNDRAHSIGMGGQLGSEYVHFPAENGNAA